MRKLIVLANALLCDHRKWVEKAADQGGYSSFESKRRPGGGRQNRAVSGSRRGVLSRSCMLRISCRAMDNAPLGRFVSQIDRPATRQHMRSMCERGGNAWPKRSMACSKRMSSTSAARGAPLKLSNTPHLNESIGSTIAACWNPSETSHQRKPKQTAKRLWKDQTWLRK